jgi:hypothetical protein
MSAPHHSLPHIPTLEAYEQPDELACVNLDIEAYLRCEDLAATDGIVPVASFAADDISLIRKAYQLATMIRALEASEGPITAESKRVHRVTGAALTYVIQQTSTRIREISDDQVETVGQFRDLIVSFVVQRMRGTSSLNLYEQMQGDYWTDRLQEGVLSCVEQLWEVSNVSGLIFPKAEMHTVMPVLMTMATAYTVSWFGTVELQHVDVMTMDFVVNRLSCHTLKLLNKQR